VYLSQAVGYALHAMRRLVPCSGRERLFAGDIARSIGASESYLAKILQSLTKAELLDSERGMKGGYALARPAREVTVRQVIEAVEGLSPENRCLFGIHTGQDCPTCPVQCVLNEVHGRLLQELDHVTIDMLPTFGADWDESAPAGPIAVVETVAGENIHVK